jgi:hypothetical protein
MNGNGGMKSESWIIVELGVVLAAFGILAFWKAPAYEKAAWYVIGVFSNGLSLVLGYKFGKGMPEQAGEPKPGQTATTDTHTESGPLPNPPAPGSGDAHNPL